MLPFLAYKIMAMVTAAIIIIIITIIIIIITTTITVIMLVGYNYAVTGSRYGD